MRGIRSAWLLLLLVGCEDSDGHDEGSEDTCQIAALARRHAMTALRADEPVCTRDDDCVVLDHSIECRQASLGSCGVTLHREAAGRWDAEAVCAVADKRSPRSDLHCAVSNSCVSEGEPRCLEGRCVDSSD